MESMEAFERVILTTMCMIYDEDKILVQNKVNGEWCGLSLPGGPVSFGESLVGSLIDEVRKETGLTVKEPQLCGIKDWTNYDGSRNMLLLYKTNQYEGEIITAPGNEVFWANKDELIHEELAADLGDLFKVFQEETISEFYFFEKDGKWDHILQ